MTTADREKFAAAKEAYITKAIEGLDKDLAALQRKFFDDLTENLLTQLDTENGKYIRSVNNFAKLNGRLNDLMQQFTVQFGTPIIKDFAEKLVKTLELTDNMYKDSRGYNVSSEAFRAMQEQSKWVYERLGIRPDGSLIDDGYLMKLRDMPEVQGKVREYITNNVVNGAGISEFQKGFKELVLGTPDMPGEIVKYHQQYSFDLFNQADAAINNVYAKTQGLTKFIYFGSLIDTSRCFCRKRAGKVFDLSDTKDWENDPTLISYYKKDGHSYNPAIDRGGFNCRHSFEYISDAMAKQMGYSKTVAAEINEAECE